MMKKILILFAFLWTSQLFGQEQQSGDENYESNEEQIVNEEEDSDESEMLQRLHGYIKNPLNLNIAADEELALLGLSPFHIQSLKNHIEKFGQLVSIYELQSVSGWLLNEIYKILPYVCVREVTSTAGMMRKRFLSGNHFLLLRTSLVLELAKGFQGDSSNNKYLGDRQKLFVRYQFRSARNLSIGITGEKDAGEKYFRNRAPTAFDFTSYHFMVADRGIFKSFVLGDYTIQAGQGLLIWQGGAFQSGSGVLFVKRQAAAVRPYTASGEFNFCRGLAFVIGLKRWQLLSFVSNRKLDASLSEIDGSIMVSTVNRSGLHRTRSELEKRNNLKLTSAGICSRYTFSAGHLGVNYVQHRFSLPFFEKREPYAQFQFSGYQMSGYSFDYSITKENVHLSGEMALDSKMNKAITNSLLVALDARVDLALQHRMFQKNYHSFFSSAFADQSAPVNESGYYAGLSVRPSRKWMVDACFDVAMFPWLRYGTDAPSIKNSGYLQVRYIPLRNIEWSTRLKLQTNLLNANDDSAFHMLIPERRSSWRIDLKYPLSALFTFRHRIEFTWYGTGNNSVQRNAGYLVYCEAFYKPPLKHYGLNMRCQFFETIGYDARVYAYEQDVLYNGYTPSFSGSGFRYYLNLHFQNKKKTSSIKPVKIDFYFRWAQTLYSKISTVGSGTDEINGNKRSELKLELITTF
ncbi:MAG TPA: hypothetical protein VM012_06645 [Flavitalea sp.]|nr:hypothetical protein [Flavitalea sp.]